MGTKLKAQAIALSELQIHKLRTEVATLQKVKKALLGQLAAKDRQLDDMGALAGAKAPRAIKARKGRGWGVRRQATAVMLCSDWHVEEHVDPKTVNGINEYTLDIADACIRKMPEAFEWLIRDPRFDIREAIVWLGGDLISGYIHEELQEHNFLSPVQATLWLYERLCAMIDRILADTDLAVLHVDCNDGNHGRLTHKIRVSTRTQNSIEYLLYKTLAAHYVGNPRVRFNVAEGEYLYHGVYDQTLCFFHGDSVRYQGGVGGLLIPMRRGLNEHRKLRHVDVYNFGHFHEYLSLQDMSGNGSMIGMTPYALRLKCSPQPRQQSFYLLDSTRGKCQATPIWL